MQSPDSPSFFRQHIAPALLVPLIPVAAILLFTYGIGKMDRDIREGFEARLAAEQDIDAATKAAIFKELRERPVSAALLSDDPRDVNLANAISETARERYAAFRWLIYAGWMCIGLVLLTVIAVGLLAAAGYRTQEALYRSMRTAWPLLFAGSALQVILQGALLSFMSFWGTVLFTDSYSPKLVIIVSLLALLGIGAVLRALFVRHGKVPEISGQVLSSTDAPALWSGIGQLAERMQTRPPDQIVAGAQPGFFVTESSATCGGKPLLGRTLYVCLPMMKVLSRTEADAVLAHELAHFSGQDTYWSTRLGPLVSRFSIHLEALSHGAALPAGRFMQLVWLFFHFLLQRLSREREFRADRLAAEAVSASAFGAALLKISAFSEHFSDEVEKIMASARRDGEASLGVTLNQGFPAYLTAYSQDGKFLEKSAAHPFDSHPPNAARLSALGISPGPGGLQAASLNATPPDSWFHSLPAGAEIESALWQSMQENVEEIHDAQLAWRLTGETQEEQQLIRRAFPSRTFTDKKGNTAVLEFDRITLSTRSSPILFTMVTGAVKNTAFVGGEYLQLTVSGGRKPEAVRIMASRFKDPGGQLMEALILYLSRHASAHGVSFA